MVLRSHFEQEFWEKYSERMLSIFYNPDGRFPAHDTDTSRFANYQPLMAEIQKNGSDLDLFLTGMQIDLAWW
jgi:hypothetical protein